MRFHKGVKLRLEEEQGVQPGSILTEFLLPEVNHLRLGEPLVGTFGWWIIEDGQWIWKRVFGGYLSHLQKPIAGGWLGMGEDIGAMAVEDGAGTQAADHSKEGELSEVKEGCERETTT